MKTIIIEEKDATPVTTAVLLGRLPDIPHTGSSTIRTEVKASFLASPPTLAAGRASFDVSQSAAIQGQAIQTLNIRLPAGPKG